MKIQCFALSLLLLSMVVRGDNELDMESRKNSRVGEPTMLNSIITAQDLITKSKHLTSPTRPPTALTQYAPQNTHFYYSPYATASPIGSGYLLPIPAQHNSVLATNSPLGMNYGFQYVQMIPRPMVLPINPYAQYSSFVQQQQQQQQQQHQTQPQPQAYLSHTQNQQTAASTHHHHHQTPSPQQYLSAVPPTQQTAASMTIASPVNPHYVPYTPPLQTQQPVGSFSSPIVSYFAAPPAARYHYAVHPQEMSLNTNEYMPGQLESGFRAIKRV
ncbi:TOX high mobility group box family member 3-like [Lutzomyia longipalpis]|uniref:TOX high mobility group box family member 3-like n=1 Tax=Lutzomyia longipalpis TaxID=7200 RepID=UPI002483ECA7|nr:TOX high mobility group box family member 3-like [Lutzomyia longipalpis]